MSKKEPENLEMLRLSNAESNIITRESIQAALIMLMKRKRFSEISITEIVKKAGVSRTAYYRNYASKESILESHVTQIVTGIYASMNNNPAAQNLYGFWLSMFKAVMPHAESFKLLLEAQFGESIENGIYQMLIASHTNVTSAEKYIERFWSGAVYAVMKQWILDGMKISPEDMATICCKVNDD